MLLYRTRDAILLQANSARHPLPEKDWDALINTPGLAAHLRTLAASAAAVEPPAGDALLAPLGSQEIWAAGVTYFRSRTARMEESQDAGGGSFYDRVYSAERPEIFFKSTAQRVAHPGHPMHLRRDSKWMVPEPEWTLVLNRSGEIVGYTIGNDLSCRDIEGENPLYLPQAKCFDRCASVGPAVLVAEDPIDRAATKVRCVIERDGDVVFEGSTSLDQLKRSPEELAEFLFRDNRFETGALLMTGTGIVPGDDFTLVAGDVVKITIDGIGTLANPME
jgi:2-dehydro-3-deoxy-D-arabinonate dehydratase